ncbi:MAG TPA: S-adenosyl-l-methionine hydroxide adenosyltransferase family protein [Panacibacter sp.]|nr:S-adenosyl-l-methionine hydroxide adenosyltransferase family protein [Panacibacter sp.]
MKRIKQTATFIVCCIIILHSSAQNKLLVFQSDFGLKDGAVSAMKGVAMGVSTDLRLFDLTHEIPAYNIWEAAYRLQQTAQYWPAGTVFVSVVDPGVGSARKSVVLKTKNGQFFVTPDNGTLTLIAQSQGIEAIREIDENKNRRPGSGESYTFHGRDVYAYTGARLASGIIKFEDVGPELPNNVVTIDYQKAVYNKAVIKGNIPILDIQYGNIWTNIDGDTFKQLGIQHGELVQVKIYHKNKKIYEGAMPFVATFSAVSKGKPLCYLNSLLNVSFALNEGSFSGMNKVLSGPEWAVEIGPQTLKGSK